MFKLEINATTASKTAAAVRAEKEQREKELFNKQIQTALDGITQYIIKAVDAGLFETVVPYVNQEPEFTGDVEPPIIMTDEACHEVKLLLRHEGGYEVSAIKNKVGSLELKITWPDPREEEEEDGCK